MSPLPDILASIVEGRRARLPEIRERLAGVEAAALPRSTRSLKDALAGGPTSFIMECKSSSPSLGSIRPHYEPGEMARVYSRYASAISVLCEPERFGGDYDHLQTVALSTHLPVLCKDFIIDPIQVRAARRFGADAILLMMSILDDDSFCALKAEADSLGLDVLVEAITAEEIERALRLGARIIGINNRDLHDLSIDLGRTERLAPLVPAGCVIVSESGIRSAADVHRLDSIVDAFLIGSRLSGSGDIDLTARRLLFGENKVCGLTSITSAQVARAAGAVYGGLVLDEDSPRRVTPRRAAEIIDHEPGLRYVAVTRRTGGFAELAGLGVHAVQLHAPWRGSFEAERAFIEGAREDLAALGLDCEVWRAVSMTEEEGPERAAGLLGCADRLILDSASGGSGKAFDWSRIPEGLASSCLLAGGLNPSNLPEALALEAAGLDLNSGLESSPGVKDSALIARAFALIRAHRGARPHRLDSPSTPR